MSNYWSRRIEARAFKGFRMDKDATKILTEEIDEETLCQMPLWFRILRSNYKKIKEKVALSKDVH